MLRRPRTPPPRSTPLPARLHSPHTISSHPAPGHSQPSRGTSWECRRGTSAGRAGGSRKPGRPRSRAGTGRTGRSPACGRREVSSGRRHFTPPPAPSLHPSPLLPGLTRVLTHTELGTQLCCPVSHSLMSVQTCVRGSAAVTAPRGHPRAWLRESSAGYPAPPPRLQPDHSQLGPSLPGLPSAGPTTSTWSEAGKRPRGSRSSRNKMRTPPPRNPPGATPQALTCLLVLAKGSPTPSWAGPLYPEGQASHRKPGLVLMQRTRGKQGCALHWRTRAMEGQRRRSRAPQPRRPRAAP